MIKNSPIKLRSSSKAKLKATRSPSRLNEDSQLMCDDSRIRSSVHTIPIKQSPSRQGILKSNFTQEQINHANNQSYNSLILRSGSPASRNLPPMDLYSSAKLKGSKSFCNIVSSQTTPYHHRVMVSPQKSNMENSIVMNQTLPHIMSPAKSNINNERSFIRIELGKKTPSKILVPTTRMVNSPKVVSQQQQIHYQVPSKEVQLQRKVRILQSRIGQLHGQKNQVQTHLNQVNIRLQYQNNFLKQKLNSYSSRRESNEKHQPIILNKQASSQLQAQKVHCKTCQENSSSKTLSHSSSQKLIKDLQKSEQNEYHQSKEIHSLKQQLFQTQDMLSKEINKSLELLEELANKEKQNEDLKIKVKAMQEKMDQIERKIRTLQLENQSLMTENGVLSPLKERLAELQYQRGQLQNQITSLSAQVSLSQQLNQTLQSEVRQLKSGYQQNLITKDLLNDLQQNNQLLISAIRTLQASLKQSQKQISTLIHQKSQLQNQINELQSQVYDMSNNFRQKQNEYQSQIDRLAAKLIDIETQLIEKNTQIQEINQCLDAKSMEVKQKEIVLKTQEDRIETLLKAQEQEGNSSTANSFYNKNKDPCMKCDELRKTVFKLNSHLNTNRSPLLIQDQKRTC